MACGPYSATKGKNMNDSAVPALGEAAPFFEARVGEAIITLKDFRGRWLIIFSHPADVLPLFETRTINYILCKRRTKVVAFGNGEPSPAETRGDFLKKYILKHSLMILDDPGGKIVASYGLKEDADGAEMKGVFIVDPAGNLRVKLVSPLHGETDFCEILKLRDALEEADKQKAKSHVPKAWRKRLRITMLPTLRGNT
jgi:peroxiredoxin (alkyl hydroperoxide reductase subunit C)